MLSVSEISVTVKDKSTVNGEAVVHFEGNDERGIIVKLSLSGLAGFEADYEVGASYTLELAGDVEAPAKSRKK